MESQAGPWSSEITESEDRMEVGSISGQPGSDRNGYCIQLVTAADP